MGMRSWWIRRESIKESQDEDLEKVSHQEGKKKPEGNGGLYFMLSEQNMPLITYLHMYT